MGGAVAEPMQVNMYVPLDPINYYFTRKVVTINLFAKKQSWEGCGLRDKVVLYFAFSIFSECIKMLNLDVKI